MSTAPTVSRPRPSWFVRFIMTAFRILFLTVLFTGLGMAVGLTTGILVTVIGSAFTHHALDMTRAYRSFAIPSAIIVGSCALLYQIVTAVKTASVRR